MPATENGYILSVKCPAKANLFLEVIKKRNDGFHDIVSVFQPLDFLYDTLHAKESENISLLSNCHEIPLDENNLVIKAAILIQRKCGIKRGVEFFLEKRIPDGGGLGGGSANAAAALKMCNELWSAGLSGNELADIALELGSDVPYFIYGGVCLCEGRGEIITPLPHILPRSLSIVVPKWKISTPLAYKSLNACMFNRHRVDEFLHELEYGDNFYGASYNCFEEAVFRIEPRQLKLHKQLLDWGCQPRMSGSGSCIWICNNRHYTELEQARITIPD